MTINLAQYYDRFDPADCYERHLFRAGNVLQSAELNELQSAIFDRLQRTNEALFIDGNILAGATIQVDQATGIAALANGAIYLRGAVRGVPPATLLIPTDTTVLVGIYLCDTVITEDEDSRLRDPAISLRNFQEPGAARLKVTATWGYEGDDQPGDFYRIYQVRNGEVITNQPPPTVDTVAQTVARYDRQSTGGAYVSHGLTVTRLSDDEQGRQIYSLAEGVARVMGHEIVKEHATRIVYPAVPDTRSVMLEPHLVTSATGADLRLEVNHAPINALTELVMTRVVTEELDHGPVSGSQDLITMQPVLQIVAVTQGETTFVANQDYQLTNDRVDWSLAGNEPAPGSAYTVQYQYIDTATEPTSNDDNGFTVPGTIQVELLKNPAGDAELVTGTLVQVSYRWAMPRYDLICLDADGQPVTVKGVAAQERPRIPAVPRGLLSLAVIEQLWKVNSRVINHGTRMVAMSELNRLNQRMDTLFALIAEERLALNMTQRDATAKKGVFADPLIDDDLRDQGLPQTAAIFNGSLTLGVEATVHSQRLTAPATLNARVIMELDETVGPEEVVISQTLRTSNMKVNPYDAFSPLPGIATLEPAVDFWTDFSTNWLSPVTRQFNEDVWTNPETMETWWRIGEQRGEKWDRETWLKVHSLVVGADVQHQADVESVGAQYVDLAQLRPIEVRFALAGFGAGEVLSSVTFDGQLVAFSEVV